MLVPSLDGLVLSVNTTWKNRFSDDLDISATFLDATVGYACADNNNASYISFFDTAAGYRDGVFVDLGTARTDSAWGGATEVSVSARWFLLGGMDGGRVLLEAAMVERESRKVVEGTQVGFEFEVEWDGGGEVCADTEVGRVQVRETSDGVYVEVKQI